MLIGLSGTHGTGKTTLAKTAAEQFGCGFIRTTVSDVFARLGKDPRVHMTFDERMGCQFAILDELVRQWEAASPSTITLTDRTPIDLIGYVLSAVDSYQGLTPEEDACLADYMSLCVAALYRLFDRVAMVPMANFKVAEVSKIRGNMSWGNRIKLESLMFGSLHRIVKTPAPFVTTIQSVDLDERVEEVREFIGLTFCAELYA